MTLPRLLCCLPLLLLAVPAWAEDARVDELERKVDLLAREIEDLKLGEAPDTAEYRSAFGLAPAASKVYGVTRGVSLGGYGEALYQKHSIREDGRPSGLQDQLDFVREIVYLGYKFDEDLLFNSEIEFEHASTERAGDVSVEFAYLDWRKGTQLGVRGGLLLVPVGLVNEYHEPPVILAARRPEVERRIIPTTWRANGAGLFGELPLGLAYRAYLMESLVYSGFTPDQPLREARMHGSEALAKDFAVAARLDWTTSGLLAGASVFRGRSGQGASDAAGKIHAPVTLWDAHARWQWRGLEARALWSEGRIEQVDRLAALDPTLSGLGSRFHGGYAEATYEVLPLMRPQTRYGLAPYVRYESLDTQEQVPAGAMEDPALESSLVTVGAALRPHPNVVMKVDREFRHNEARTETDQWNVALGYLF